MPYSGGNLSRRDASRSDPAGEVDLGPEKKPVRAVLARSREFAARQAWQIAAQAHAAAHRQVLERR
jgi:hypothetical protein